MASLKRSMDSKLEAQNFGKSFRNVCFDFLLLPATLKVGKSIYFPTIFYLNKPRVFQKRSAFWLDRDVLEEKFWRDVLDAEALHKMKFILLGKFLQEP